MTVKDLSLKETIILLAGLLVTMLVFWSIGQVYSGARWPLAAILAAAIVFAFHHRNRLNENLRPALIGVMVGAILTFSLVVVLGMYHNVMTPGEWDFQAFWLWGKAAVARYDFYNPRYFEQLVTSLGLTPSSEFVTEIVDVGFWYPPPTMFLFLPLGWFESVNAALFAWYVVNGLFLVADIYLLWSIFLRESGKLGLVLSAMLMLILLPTWTTVSHAQTNFAMLLAVLLFWRDRHNPRAGVWLTVGAVIKPIVAGLSLYLLLRKKWRALITAVVSGAAIMIAAFLVFGSETFMSYFAAAPTSRLPAWVYTEEVNQSLLATVLRLTEFDFSHTSPLTHPLFLFLTAILTVCSAYLVYVPDKMNDDRALALNVSFVLLAYPASLASYGVLLVLLALLLWESSQQGTLNILSAAVAIGVVYLIAWRPGMFFAYLASWLIAAFLILKPGRSGVAATESA